MSLDFERKKVMTPKFRVSFCDLFEARAMEEGAEPKFGITMLFDAEAQASPEFKKMREVCLLVAKDFFGDKLDVLMKGGSFRKPFRDGDEKADQHEEYAGKIFVRATTKKKPGLVNQSCEDIIDREEIYSGCYCRATLNAYAYDTRGNKGVTFGLLNVQKLGDGEPLSARNRPAADDFTPVQAAHAASDVSVGDDEIPF